ncbi:MAG: hypothetical protein BWY04_01528 [candidate division CPR1 bacterium ADurb.Bin160]|uniref:Uncharacterized protein n=1 Tax=candidate division CPR1 bacterium ADurb.Bin160 TaxID=1852826 RepID=A0A1V5ZII4_9BACT|nr:MAG: hypothetical protein BWY04_01528 [candidate division CPR1 bacterium ADurb.Bin160]
MNIIYICTTILLSMVILSLFIYKSFYILSKSLDKIEFNFTINKESISYDNKENIDISKNNQNIYEKNIKESMITMHSKILEKPILTSGKSVNTNIQDDDIGDISKQLKGMR